MKLENRIIHRMGARDLTPEEIEKITGAFITFTVCTFATVFGTGGGDEGNNSHDGC